MQVSIHIKDIFQLQQVSLFELTSPNLQGVIHVLSKRLFIYKLWLWVTHKFFEFYK